MQLAWPEEDQLFNVGKKSDYSTCAPALIEACSSENEYMSDLIRNFAKTLEGDAENFRFNDEPITCSPQ